MLADHPTFADSPETTVLYDPAVETLDIDVRGDTATWCLAVAGEVDGMTTAQLHRAVLDVLRLHHPREIQIDLRDVAFLDSSGIRTLVRCHTEADQAGCRLRLTEVSPQVRRVLEITGLRAHLGLT